MRRIHVPQAGSSSPSRQSTGAEREEPPAAAPSSTICDDALQPLFDGACVRLRTCLLPCRASASTYSRRTTPPSDVHLSAQMAWPRTSDKAYERASGRRAGQAGRHGVALLSRAPRAQCARRRLQHWGGARRRRARHPGALPSACRTQTWHASMNWRGRTSVASNRHCASERSERSARASSAARSAPLWRRSVTRCAVDRGMSSSRAGARLVVLENTAVSRG
ncbi:hypothetical protein OH77DRAFT_1300935 [Trametes cingulata]|nr:hypothetical protein OH77DRAFT_1300935 [Trametes cingulata]